MVCKLERNVAIMVNILIICLVSDSFYGGWYKVEGRIEPFLSIEEDLELERQLKVLNKPPVQSFQKEDGSIIDCIDIYNQPAFAHPLLKNHQLQMQPSSILIQKVFIPIEHENDKLICNSKSKFPGCPTGTVPILRTRKHDLIRAKAASTHYRPMTKGPTVTPPVGINYAGISTQDDTSDKYVAAKISITVHNLTMAIPSQTSTASLRLGSGVDGPFSSVEYGWTFNQQLYGDTKARTFSLWTADGFQKTGCFNTLCPGFVQVSKIRHMGDEITDLSEYGKDAKFMVYGIGQDPSSGNWWIIEDIPQEKHHWVGYWPKELFPSMNEFAKNVQIGGKVFNPSPEPSETPMGSGHYLPGEFLKTCNVDVNVINSSRQLVPESHLQVLANAPEVYNADFPEEGSILFFGGPTMGDLL